MPSYTNNEYKCPICFPKDNQPEPEPEPKKNLKPGKENEVSVSPVSLVSQDFRGRYHNGLVERFNLSQVDHTRAFLEASAVNFQTAIDREVVVLNSQGAWHRRFGPSPPSFPSSSSTRQVVRGP